MTANLTISPKQIAEFCRRNQIRKMSLFGSVLRHDFSDDSDVDVLVEFNPGTRIGLIGLAGLELDLGRLLGRKVEMHTPKGLNPLFKTEVLKLAEVQYEQA